MGHYLADQPAGKGLLGIKNTPGVRPFGGLADTHYAGQKPIAASFIGDAQLRKDQTKFCLVRCQANVHGQGHGDSHTDGHTIDGRNKGLFHVVNSQGHNPANVPVGLQSRFCLLFIIKTFIKVMSGTKPSPRSGNDDNPHIIIGIRAIEGIQELRGHDIIRKGIEFFRPVKGYG